MPTTFTISTFFFAILAMITTCNGAGLGAGQDPISYGYNADCAISYKLGCQFAGLNPQQGLDAVTSGPLGAYLAFVSGFTAGFACGICESGFFGNGTTTTSTTTSTTPTNGKGAQCGYGTTTTSTTPTNGEGAQCGKGTTTTNTTPRNGKGGQCGSHTDRQAECCKDNGPQCGDNTFQQTYNAVYPAACKSGYDFGSTNVEQGSLILLGLYFGGLFCGIQGFVACLPVSALGGGSSELTNQLSGVLNRL